MASSFAAERRWIKGFSGKELLIVRIIGNYIALLAAQEVARSTFNSSGSSASLCSSH
jgi:hypothetical protein